MPYQRAIVLGFLCLACAANTARAQGADAPLRRGDLLLVKVQGDSTVSDEYRIEADGSVLLPRVGRVNLANVSASDVPAVVRQSLSRAFLAEQAIVRPLRRVTVVGEVTKPGVYHVELLTSLREAVAGAGALGQFADPGYVVLLRGGTERRLDNWQRSQEANEPVVSGDVLSIPRENWLRRNALNVVSSLGIVITTFVAVRK
jgi:protein involved in polysaccharide export with SLBB domain